MEKYATPEEFLAAEDSISPDRIESLEKMFASSDSDNAKWTETQKARSEYIKEWEEDMRYAQELASEGM